MTGKKITNKFLHIIITMTVILSLVGTSFPTYASTTKATKTAKSTDDFNVGKGIKWPERVVAPYVDMTSWVEGDYGIKGVLDLWKISRETKVKFFNLGFVQGISVEDKHINWGWGAFKKLNEKSSDGFQYEGIKESISNLRKKGGDVAISFGGGKSGAFWTLTQDKNILANTYSEIIKGYNLTRIDLDVEGSAMDVGQNRANAEAIKKVQDETGVQVVLTLPVMDYGLTKLGLEVLKTYVEAGIELTNINIMTMMYGESVADYAKGSTEAVDNTAKQIQKVYKESISEDLTLDDAYLKLGTTPSIGFEREGHPYFTTDMTKQVVEHAVDKKIGMVSFWSMNRDSMVDGGLGKIKVKYGHTKETNLFFNELCDYGTDNYPDCEHEVTDPDCEHVENPPTVTDPDCEDEEKDKEKPPTVTDPDCEDEEKDKENPPTVTDPDCEDGEKDKENPPTVINPDCEDGEKDKENPPTVTNPDREDVEKDKDKEKPPTATNPDTDDVINDKNDDKVTTPSTDNKDDDKVTTPGTDDKKNDNVANNEEKTPSTDNKVSENESAPNTGDLNIKKYFIIIALVSILAIGATLIIRKKKNK